MQLRRFTDPITGTEFKALSDKDGNLKIQTAFDGVITATYDESSGTYTIPAWVLNHRETLSANQAAKYMHVSRAYISRICSTGLVKSIKLHTGLIIDKASLDDLRSNGNGTDNGHTDMGNCPGMPDDGC